MIGIKWTKVPKWIRYICLVLWVVWALPWSLAYEVCRALLALCLWMHCWDPRKVSQLWRDTQ